MKTIIELSPPEILALAISSEEEDGCPCTDLAEGLRAEHPGTVRILSDMAAEENGHRRAPMDIRWRSMDTPPLSATAKIMLGGGLVVATGVLIGSS